MAKQKGFRLSDEIWEKFQELKEVYQARSENHLLELLICDIYKLKKSKALVPFEELKETGELPFGYRAKGFLTNSFQRS